MEPGKHLILDFYGCNSELLNNYEQLKDLFEESLSLCNATVLKVTGNKSILFERLCTFFSRINASIKIQSLIRMHFSIIFVNSLGFSPGSICFKIEIVIVLFEFNFPFLGQT